MTSFKIAPMKARCSVGSASLTGSLGNVLQSGLSGDGISRDVLDELGELFVRLGPPEPIRLDNGPEFIATALKAWLERLSTKTPYIEPGSPLENGYCEASYA